MICHFPFNNSEVVIEKIKFLRVNLKLGLLSMRSASLYPFLLYTLIKGSSLFTYEVYIGAYIALMESSKVINTLLEDEIEIKKYEGHAILA